MLKTIKVYLITGFLGSGKTACLNHMIKKIPSHIKSMVLMNEFGAAGLDGVLVETSDLNIVEVNNGSIFCACVKTDFIQALAEIAVKYRPDVLFIEATGVANPVDIRRDLNLPFFKGAFSFQKQLCLVDVSNFLQEYAEFAAAGYQISRADLCVLNKCDLSDPEQIAVVQEIILRHNPGATFELTVFGQVDVARLLPVEMGPSTGEYPMQRGPSAAELQAMMRGLFCDLGAGLAPPDKLVSAVYSWCSSSVEEFMAFVESWPRAIVRAKAILKFGNGAKLRFDWILGQLTFDKIEPNNLLHNHYDKLWNQIILLAEPAVMREFDDLAHKEAKFSKIAE